MRRRVSEVFGIGGFRGFGFVFFVFDSEPGVVGFLGSSFVFSGCSVFCQSYLASSGIGWVVVVINVVSEAVKTLKFVWALSFSGRVHCVAVFLGYAALLAVGWGGMLVVFLVVLCAAESAVLGFFA